MNTLISFLPAIIVTIVHTSLGMVWFGKLMFGPLWQKIMDFNPEKMSKHELAEMQKSMGLLYMGQMVVVLIMNCTLLAIIRMLPQFNPYTLAFILWIGFIVPAQATATIWSKTPPKYIPTQIAVSTLYQLIAVWLAVAIFGLFK